MHDKLHYLLPPGPEADCPLEPQDPLERQAARRWYLYIHRRKDVQRLVLPAELEAWRTCHLKSRFSLWQWQGGQFQDLIHPQQAAATSWSGDLRPGDTVLAWGGEAALELMSYDILSPEQAHPLIGPDLLQAWNFRKPARPGLTKSDSLLLHAWAAPGLWRRVRLPAAFSLAQLSRLLQALFGWRGHHLHEFLLSHGRRYQTTEAEHYDEYLPFEEEVFLYQLLEPGSALRYHYDFGDDWWVTVHFLPDPAASSPSPWCLDGEGVSPGDDMGGPRRYRQTHYVDPFAVDDVNHYLRVAFRSRLGKVLLERDVKPPDASVPALFSLGDYNLAGLKTKELMVAALLERGGPLSWEELRVGLHAAGGVLPKGVESLRRAWKRDPLLREDGQGRVHLCAPLLSNDGALLGKLCKARGQSLLPRLQAYAQADPAVLPETVLYWQEPGGETFQWMRLPGGEARSGTPQQLKAALRLAELVVGLQPTRLFQTLGLPQAGRDYVDLDMGGQWPGAVEQSLGPRPPGLQCLEDFYEYGRGHGYVLLNAERRVVVDWNPARLPGLSILLVEATSSPRPYRLLLRGSGWTPMQASRHGCILSGPNRNRVDFGFGYRGFDLCEIVRMEQAPETLP